MSAIQDAGVRDQLRLAWEESSPGSAQAHEEGGFILREPTGSLVIERWPRGQQDEIEVPPHPSGKRGAGVIVATFHTHPNTGSDYMQEPSPADVLAVTTDSDLRHPEYEGEYVISRDALYRVHSDGNVESLGPPPWV